MAKTIPGIVGGVVRMQDYTIEALIEELAHIAEQMAALNGNVAQLLQTLMDLDFNLHSEGPNGNS
jgi:uncharacterized membrane protein